MTKYQFTRDGLVLDQKSFLSAIENIDKELFADQKETLIYLVHNHRFSNINMDHLEGLLGVLDAVTDYIELQ